MLLLSQTFPQMNIDWVGRIIHIRSQNTDLKTVKKLFTMVEQHHNSLQEINPTIQDAFILMTRQLEKTVNA